MAESLNQLIARHAAAVLADPGDLGPWARQEPAAEALPVKMHRPILLRAGWPQRRVSILNRARPGNREVEQDVIVVPLVMLERLAAALGWPLERLVRDVME